MLRRRVLCAALLAVLGASTGACGARSHHAPAAAAQETAGTWWLSPRGDDAEACTRAAPCQTISAVLARTDPGDEVRLLAGRYPKQEVRDAPHGTRAPVVLRPAAGAPVHLGELSFHTHGVELRDLRLEGWHAYADAGRLTFRDVHADWFFIDSSAHVRILGGEVGPADAVDPQIRAADTNGAPLPRDILIDDVTFHDFTNRTDPATHIECLQFGAGQHVVVRGSRFLNCRGHNIFVAPWGGTAKVRDFLFEDNHFGTVPDGFYSLRVAGGGPGAVSHITVRDNSALTVMQVDAGISHVTFEGNLAPRQPWECFPGQRYVRNVWTAVTCSGTDRTISASAMKAAAGDLHRRAGAGPLAATS
ncbi:MAG: hypothetical protein JWQ20_1051 [Conexibacter sp.]|nr:hypothetical protein [Conexibacter sp.]